MARRLLSSRAHADLFEVLTDPDALIRHYLLSRDDIDLIRTRRRAENLLGVAVHIWGLMPESAEYYALRWFDHLLGHLYSPVSRMWAHPRGEICASRSGEQSNPLRRRMATA
jgi:hypothetical protein